MSDALQLRSMGGRIYALSPQPQIRVAGWSFEATNGRTNAARAHYWIADDSGDFGWREVAPSVTIGTGLRGGTITREIGLEEVDPGRLELEIRRFLLDTVVNFRINEPGFSHPSGSEEYFAARDRWEQEIGATSPRSGTLRVDGMGENSIGLTALDFRAVGAAINSRVLVLSAHEDDWDRLTPTLSTMHPDM